ncbi:class A beta-lactamase-related serine hydrolase (plasmid) [Streptomyces sp. NBC_00984]|nr:class A beta-lactamase-related serine hydrolase [Streptomyces sp. NBC_00984]
MSEIREQIEAVFAEASAEGFLHAREVGVPDGPDVSAGGDDPVVLASVFKIPVAVAYAREVAAGRLDETEQALVTARYRIGGIGTAGCADDVEMSWRDLAHFMLTMSDNAATDLVFHRVGQEAVDRVLADLGLVRTRLIGCCEDLFASVVADLGGNSDSVNPLVLWRSSMRPAPRRSWLGGRVRSRSGCGIRTRCVVGGCCRSR